MQVQNLSCLPWADKGYILLLTVLDLQQLDGAGWWSLFFGVFFNSGVCLLVMVGIFLVVVFFFPR